MRALGEQLSQRLRAGDTVLLQGELGAGKTTLARGILEGLGQQGPVRSPTFTLIQTYDTNPPVMHCDLYRLQSHVGIGIEDYLESHLCLIEWPDRAVGLRPEEECWRIEIEFAPEGRLVRISAPAPPVGSDDAGRERA
jgi:tRNA threonylcarbamoyladenosine biosynthesis protein TsaE